ncbi:MAG TPA: hypothetical protein PKA77_18020 [Chitinophagaceae bacterium]|jgi:hypothetical protein|nr:hypothetical protein [Chitinophagaceae bacterium]
MSSAIETGHAKNVANFSTLISFCMANPAYNPAAPPLTIAGLTSKHTAARTALDNVIATGNAFNNAVNSRKTAFAALCPFATRVINALEASGATAETIKDARTINRKLQGQRATKKEPAAAAATSGNTPNTISASQQSYDQLTVHFSKLISLVTSVPAYAPNETDINTAALNAKLSSLQTISSAVADAYTAWSNSRIVRQNELYHTDTGLVAIAGKVKKYVKSVSGAGSPQYRQLSALLFKAEIR